MHRHPAAWVAVTLLICSCGPSGQVTPIGLVPRGVTVDLQDTEYTIVGSTAQDLLQGMRIGGPGNNWFSYRWELRWRYRYGAIEQPSLEPGAAEEPRCGVRDLEITATFRRVLPAWDVPEDADPDLLASWETFTTAVRVHGEGHRDVVLDAVREMSRRVGELETEDCSFMEREVESLAQRILDRHREMDREYHQETEGGRTQGVVWPPEEGVSSQVRKGGGS